YMICALVIGAIWLYMAKGMLITQSLRHLLSKRVWLHASSKADIKILLLNKAISLLYLPLIITKATIAVWLFNQLFEQLGTRPIAGALLPDWAVVGCFTAFLFLLDDFARYYLHRLMHRVPMLWAFHKVHHSARRLTPLTVLRTHPVEGLLFTLRSVFVQGVSIGVFVFFFGDQVSLITVLGVNLAVFIFNVAGSNLRHSHIALRYGQRVERWLISPAQHQIHHSIERRHFDRNFGAVLAIWDRMGGSLYLSSANESLRFGLSKRIKQDEQHLRTLYLRPFKEAAMSLVKRLL
ncbi:MAG: sterol desaturase family protein, partial [Pontibacterium sp.]